MKRLSIPLALLAVIAVAGCHNNQPETEGMPAGVGKDTTVTDTTVAPALPTDTLPGRDTIPRRDSMPPR